MASPASRTMLRRPLVGKQPTYQTLLLARSQSTNSSLPPESPHHVDVPQPLQPQDIVPPRMKGILPRPRKIFKQDGVEKDSEEYYDSVNPERSAERPVPSPRHKEFVDYKARLTGMRRKNLREGIHQLRLRKAKTDSYLRAQSRKRQEDFKAAVAKQKRQDERLTESTVLDIKHISLADGLSAEEVAQRRGSLAAREAVKAEDRRVNLHTLYMNARDFIVTEEQLNKRVDEAFDAPFYQNQNDPSIWKEYGVPERVSDLVDRSQGRSKMALEANEGYAQLTRQRLQRITEELTGGKMEDPGQNR